VGRNFLEQFKPFRTNAVFDTRKPGDIAAWLRHASDKASGDGIGNLIKYDWHSTGHLLQGGHSWGGASKDDVRGVCHQFQCSFAKIARFPSILNL
jgi:hypothetical protein